MNFLVIFIIPWDSISLTERNNCSFPAGLNEFFLNSGGKGLRSVADLGKNNLKIASPVTLGLDGCLYHPTECSLIFYWTVLFIIHIANLSLGISLLN